LRRDDPEIWNNLGNACLDCGRTFEAARCYRKALQLDSGFHSAWNNLGILHEREGRPAEALDCYRRCLALAPDHPMYQLNRALVLVRLEQPEEAIRELTRLVESEPDFGCLLGSLDALDPLRSRPDFRRLLPLLGPPPENPTPKGP
jgi:tetratricopeptide (TPR) repeat protein